MHGSTSSDRMKHRYCIVVWRTKREAQDERRCASPSEREASRKIGSVFPARRPALRAARPAVSGSKVKIITHRSSHRKDMPFRTSELSSVTLSDPTKPTVVALCATSLGEHFDQHPLLELPTLETFTPPEEGLLAPLLGPNAAIPKNPNDGRVPCLLLQGAKPERAVGDGGADGASCLLTAYRSR